MGSHAPIIVSYFTPPYTYEAMGLESTAKAFGLETDIQAVPDLGKWELNCGRKPEFIRSMMKAYPHRPIVWLDADARVSRQPVLFDSLTCDFAAHWRHGSELLSGTMYFGPTHGAQRLLDAWCEAQHYSPETWDQRTLQSVIESGEVGGLDLVRLPSEYTRVFDDAKMGDAVIEHGQASRRLRQD